MGRTTITRGRRTSAARDQLPCCARPPCPATPALVCNGSVPCPAVERRWLGRWQAGTLGGLAPSGAVLRRRPRRRARVTAALPAMEPDRARCDRCGGGVGRAGWPGWQWRRRCHAAASATAHPLVLHHACPHVCSCGQPEAAVHGPTERCGPGHAGLPRCGRGRQRGGRRGFHTPLLNPPTCPTALSGLYCPVGPAQTLVAIVGGIALAWLAGVLDRARIVTRTRWAVPLLYAGCALLLLVGAMVPGRPVLNRPTGRAHITRAAGRAPPPFPASPRLMTVADSDARFAAMDRGEAKEGRRPGVSR